MIVDCNKDFLLEAIDLALYATAQSIGDAYEDGYEKDEDFDIEEFLDDKYTFIEELIELKRDIQSISGRFLVIDTDPSSTPSLDLILNKLNNRK